MDIPLYEAIVEEHFARIRHRFIFWVLLAFLLGMFVGKYIL